MTVVDGTTVFRVCGSANFDCPSCLFVSEVWRTDITPVELCVDEECGSKVTDPRRREGADIARGFTLI